MFWTRLLDGGDQDFIESWNWLKDHPDMFVPNDVRVHIMSKIRNLVHAEVLMQFVLHRQE